MMTGWQPVETRATASADSQINDGGKIMKPITAEIYNSIVSSVPGTLVSTKGRNGNDYSQTVLDVLTQQGYKKNVDFESVFDWNTCRTYIKKISNIRPYSEPKHDIKPGDIVYNSWGYDQTNIDFYQVVAVTAKTISIREIKCCSVDYNGHQMTGSTVAVKDSFCSDVVMKKTPYLFCGSWRINFEYGAGGVWDGKPMAFSCYA
jgi:hypothetical protein